MNAKIKPVIICFKLALTRWNGLRLDPTFDEASLEGATNLEAFGDCPLVGSSSSRMSVRTVTMLSYSAYSEYDIFKRF